MAKVRHRIFEMYELRDEAIRELAPRSAQPATENAATENAATENAATDSWNLKHLSALRSSHTAHVQFKNEQPLNQSELREDLSQLADQLVKNSRVLLDFTGVMSFDASAIEALVQFNQKLKNKGSRIALCCLAPEVRQTFFERNNGHQKQN